MKNKDQWRTDIFQSSPIIRQLDSTTKNFKNFKHWPNINDYNKLFSEFSLDISAVPQSTEINSFEEHYEPRVFLKQELQTRTENWHDFFNAMIWLNFPKTKTALNELHYSRASNRIMGSNRSSLENRITQFDECGAILISHNTELLDLVRRHQWHELFIKNQQQFANNFRCIVFGHAIFEKALSPYIGMTCHCILVNSDIFLEQTRQGNYSQLDEFLANEWKSKIVHKPEKFSPFPVLGIPGYWHKQDKEFYLNTNYFR